MSEFKIGDIVVSLIDQESSTNQEPVSIREGYVGENISPLDNQVVFFDQTVPGKGCYKSENFRLATDDEKEQFLKGRKIVEPESPFEEGDIIIVDTNEIISIDKKNTLKRGVMGQIDGIVKTKDISKSMFYFASTLFDQPHTIDGYYRLTDKFRLATQEEIDNESKL